MTGIGDHNHQGGSPSSAAAAAFSNSVSMALRGGRSVLSIRRNQVVSMENSPENELHELDLFQTHVADHLLSLSSPSSHHQHEVEEEKKDNRHQWLLSIPFFHKLLGVFISCEEEFKTLLVLLLNRNPAVIARPPIDRLVSDLLDRFVKSLDICNAVTLSLDSLRHSHKHGEIAAAALLGHQSTSSLPLGEAQFSRARNALSKLLALISTEEKTPTAADRIWSFNPLSSRGSATSAAAVAGNSVSSRYPQRSLSLTVSRTWSAGRQLQSMASTLYPPRGGEGGPLALAVYTMSAVLVFVMWALVAAFPTQERCPAPGFPSPPRQLPWAGPMLALQEKLGEEWRKKEKKAAALMPAGLLAELQGLERCGRALIELGEAGSFPVDEDRAEEIAARAAELAETCRAVEEEAGPLQRQVREVFHRIVRSRAEVVEFTAQGSRAASSSASNA